MLSNDVLQQNVYPFIQNFINRKLALARKFPLEVFLPEQFLKQFFTNYAPHLLTFLRKFWNQKMFSIEILRFEKHSAFNKQRYCKTKNSWRPILAKTKVILALINKAGQDTLFWKSRFCYLIRKFYRIQMCLRAFAGAYLPLQLNAYVARVTIH